MTHASRIVYFAFTLVLAACGKKAPAPRTPEEIAQKTAETNEQIQKTTEELTKLADEKVEATAEADKAKEKLADAQAADGKDKPSEKVIQTLKADVEKKTDEVAAVAEQSKQTEQELAALKAEHAKLEEEARALEAEKARVAQAELDKKTAEDKKTEEAKAEKKDSASDGVFSFTNLLPSATSLFTIHQKLPERIGAPVFYPELKTKLPHSSAYTKYVRLNDDTFATVSWMNDGLHILRFKVSTTTGDASERTFLDVALKDASVGGYFHSILDARATDKGGLDVLIAKSESIVLVHLDANLSAVKKYSLDTFRGSGSAFSANVSGLLVNDDTVAWSERGEVNVVDAKLESGVRWCNLPSRGYVGTKGVNYTYDDELILGRAKGKNQFYVFSHGPLANTRRVMLVETTAKVGAAAVNFTCDGLRVARETDRLDQDELAFSLDRAEGDSYFYGSSYGHIVKTAANPGVEPYRAEKQPAFQVAQRSMSEESYSLVAPMVGTFAAAEYTRLDFLNADLKVEKSYKQSATMNSLKTIDSETKVVAATDVEGNLLLIDGTSGSLIEQRNVFDKSKFEDGKGEMSLNENHYIVGDTIIVPVIVRDGQDISQIGFVRIQKKSK